MVLIFHSHITFERPLRYRDYEYEALWLVSTSNTVIPNLDSSLVKDLWRNGRNTPKNCIFWKYIVGGLLFMDFLIDGRRSLIWEVRLGG